MILFTVLGLVFLSLSLVFYEIGQFTAMKWIFSFSGFFLVNKIPMLFSLCLINVKVENVSLMNVIFMISS